LFGRMFPAQTSASLAVIAPHTLHPPMASILSRRSLAFVTLGPTVRVAKLESPKLSSSVGSLAAPAGGEGGGDEEAGSCRRCER